MIAFTFIDEAAIGTKRHPKPIGYGDIPVPVGEGIRLLVTMVNKSVGALVKFEGGPFRERHDGGLPISSADILTASGYLRGEGDEYFYSRDEAIAFNTVLDSLGPVTITSGILRVTYYG
jgi:hypothetical protein